MIILFFVLLVGYVTFGGTFLHLEHVKVGDDTFHAPNAKDYGKHLYQLHVKFHDKLLQLLI